MGQRVRDKVWFYLKRGRIKRLARFLRQNPDWTTHDPVELVRTSVHNAPLRVMKWLLERGFAPDYLIDPPGNTALISAAASEFEDLDRERQLKVMNLLLDYGADPNYRNDNGEVPLGFALAYGQWGAAELLIQRGADVNGIEGGAGHRHPADRTHLDWMLCRGEDYRGTQLLRSYGAKTFAELCQSGEVSPSG